MAALATLEPEQRLRLVAPFEPEPLYEQLTARGFTYRCEECADGVWCVFIEHA